MVPTRREFLTASGVVAAGLLVPSAALATPKGARAPAPATPPEQAARAQEALAQSQVTVHAGLAEQAVAAAVKAGAAYADARIVSWRSERVSVRDDHIDKVSDVAQLGISVRVLVDGGWGFAAAPRLDERSVADLAKRAVEIARKNGELLKRLGARPVTLVDAPPAKGTWVAPHAIDPLAVSVKDKADLLIAATKKILATSGVQRANAELLTVVEDKLLASSDGTLIHQIYPRVMPKLTATAIDRRRGRFAKRNFEAAPMLAGWEYVRGLEMIEAAPVIAAEALQKLHAKSVEPGVKQVVLAPSNLWLTIHESIGHPTELDRVLGFEANLAGTSFIKPDDAGKLQLGSKKVDLVADRTQPGGLATTRWDDDGVASGRWDIVKDGKFVGWQTTRDQAAWIAEKASRGTSYGEGYSGVAFQRMPNISLQPGPEGYVTEDLINATENGVYITGRGSWSIDQQRYNFQFSGQMFWEIKRGRIVGPLRDVAYQANTLEFWRSCDMLGGQGTYRLGGSFQDGKGEPTQSNAVSHGCPPARFRATIVNTGGQR